MKAKGMNKMPTLVQCVVQPPAPVWLPVASEPGVFPVRRVYCVGRNYLDHIREMGADERDPPFFFQKPADAIVQDATVVPYPSCTADLQYEVELVLAIGQEGAEIEVAQAMDHVYGFAVGIDLTRRDLQLAARKSGRPWEAGKSFDHSAPCGALMPLTRQSLPDDEEIELLVNGIVRQNARLSQMIWNCAEVVSQLSRQYRLFPGDLVYTGTPAGVGPVQPGDRMEARIGRGSALTITVGR